MKEIFLDTETTGLSFKDGHKIVEIACIETQDLIPTKKVFHKLINPLRDVPKEAFNIHGFSTEFLKDKQPFNKIADEFLSFVKNKKIIIHNAPFDVGFLNHELKILKKEEIKISQVFDTLEFSRSKYPGSSNSLDGLCKRFGISLENRVKHNALLDCELLREVYINLFDAKEPKLTFSEEESKNNNFDDSKKFYSKNILKLSSDELNKHKDFLKRDLKKNYY